MADTTELTPTPDERPDDARDGIPAPELTPTATPATGSAGAPAPVFTATPPLATRRKLTAGHIVALVAGCLLVLPGLGMFAGGGAAAIGQAVVTDDDGYWNFTLDRVESDGVAVVVNTDEFDDDDDAGDWVLDWLDLDVRVAAEGARTTDEVFVGIARSDDVDRYLSGSNYSEIVDMDGRTPIYIHPVGTETVASPLDQDFWTVQASGAELQEITWTARGGNWSAVVMNADGSPLVAADIEAGVRSDLVMPIAITLLVVGALTTAGSIVLIVVGARGKKVPVEPGPGAGRTSQDFPPPTPDAAVALDQDRTPVG